MDKGTTRRSRRTVVRQRYQENRDDRQRLRRLFRSQICFMMHSLNLCNKIETKLFKRSQQASRSQICFTIYFLSPRIWRTYVCQEDNKDYAYPRWTTDPRLTFGMPQCRCRTSTRPSLFQNSLLNSSYLIDTKISRMTSPRRRNNYRPKSDDKVATDGHPFKTSRKPRRMSRSQICFTIHSWILGIWSTRVCQEDNRDYQHPR